MEGRRGGTTPLSELLPGQRHHLSGWWRLVQGALRGMGWISALLLFVMMMLTFVDVVGRYALNTPIFGAAEMIQFLLAMTIFTGLALVNAEDDHVTVELFDDRVREAFPRLHKLLVQGVSILVMGLIVWEMFEITRHNLSLGASTIVLEWPLSILSGAVTLFAAISFLLQIASLFLPHPDKSHDMDELL